MAWAAMVTKANTRTVRSAGMRSTSRTKNASSRSTASDSPSMYSVIGQTQLAAMSEPNTAANTMSVSGRCPDRQPCRSESTQAAMPPATHSAATIACFSESSPVPPVPLRCPVCPVSSRPSRSRPIRSRPSRSRPIRSRPIRSRPSRSRPIRSRPIRSRPSRSRPIRSRPIRSRPIRSRPSHSRPIRSRPIRSRPSRSRPSPSSWPGSTTTVRPMPRDPRSRRQGRRPRAATGPASSGPSRPLRPRRRCRARPRTGPRPVREWWSRAGSP